MSPLLQALLAMGTMVGGVVSAFATVYLLNRQKHQADATIEKTKAEGEAVVVGAQQKVIADLSAEVKRLGLRIAAQEVKGEAQTLLLAEYQGREWVHMDNIATLRRALVAAGVPVPELRQPMALTGHRESFKEI